MATAAPRQPALDLGGGTKARATKGRAVGLAQGGADLSLGMCVGVSRRLQRRLLGLLAPAVLEAQRASGHKRAQSLPVKCGENGKRPSSGSSTIRYEWQRHCGPLSEYSIIGFETARIAIIRSCFHAIIVVRMLIE